MCKNCHSITLLFNEAQKDPHKNYTSVLNFLSDLESKDKIELFAGDCQLQEALDVFYSERHYTVCHYLRCTQCGQMFFLGACIRGTPIYRLIDDIESENISNKIWGKVGSKYDS